MDDPYIDNTTERSMNDQTRKALELARAAIFRRDIFDNEYEAREAIDAALSAPAAPVAQGVNLNDRAVQKRLAAQWGFVKPHAAPVAQGEPVAWRDHVEQRMRQWKQSTMNRSGDRLALGDFMDADSLEDLIDYVCDEWAAPAPVAQRDDGMPTSADERWLRRLLAARVAMPNAYTDDGEAQGHQHGISIDFMREPVSDIDAKLRALNVARIECAAPAPVAQPLTDEQIEKATGAKFGSPLFIVAVAFTRAVERAHGIEATGQEGGAA